MLSKEFSPLTRCVKLSHEVLSECRSAIDRFPMIIINDMGMTCVKFKKT